MSQGEFGSISGQLFGPDTEPGGDPVTLECSHTFYVYAASLKIIHITDGAQLILGETGFDAKGLKLSWEKEGAAYECHLKPDEAAKFLAQKLPEKLRVQYVALKQRHRARRNKTRIALVFVALFLMAPLLLMGLFLLNSDWIAGKVAAHISIEQEIQLGEITFKQIQKSKTLIDSGPDWEQVEYIGRQLTQGSVYNYHFYVIEDETLNAFAIPGGIIIFHQGLLDAVSDAEIAGVMAHEIQHVELRHSLKSLIKKAGLYLSWAVLSGDVTSGMGEALYVSLVDLSFSRNFEREADRYGLKLLLEHNYDPYGMVRFFRHLETQANNGAPVTWLSTHPSSSDRADQLQAQLEKMRSL